MLNTQIESLQKVDKKQRYTMILTELEKYPNGLTARELANKLGFVERNAVAPRLTELERKCKVKKCGVKYDEITQRNVKVYCIERR